MLRSTIFAILSSKNQGWASKTEESRGGGYTEFFNASPMNRVPEFSGVSPRTYMDVRILSVLEEGGRVFALDMNGDLNQYYKLMGAKSLSLSADMQLSLNPFTGIPEQVSGDGYQIRNSMDALLRQIVLYMSSPLSDSQKMYVDQSLNHSWLKEGSGASLDTIVNFLLTHEKKEAHEIGQRLEKFSSGENFGCLFEGPSQLTFSGPFHSVNLSQLWVYPPLRAIVLQFLLLGVFQEMTKHRMQVQELPLVVADDIDTSKVPLFAQEPVSSTQLTHPPFLVIIEDSQQMTKESKVRDFMKMYRSLIIKHRGKIVVCRGVI